jgi:aspartate/tyrosine/aromatic aminotransferase|mmetsp:Transcript_48791/g.77744  ORF Transcript_48791/g.77744 Transcript_48791/m.77744 type:complete len:400 (-) Transcript_48791:375-1574(-)|eukprot:CAMPEP_0169065516 /NCGR_PEP_ID=MMETSP1015-20121227/2448_1 /TAXON_ID=342587 /ORGANISM="Karlodinium micrum, Strain CCMP2283" /LENGTH=399 /DNA_ID=CAMNT_0009124101 /DNA_START=18 /DNA_END=1217 /DNA_ORIENTATION=+
MSIFANVAMAPADPILGLNNRFKADTFEKKVNLGVGAYRTAEGKRWILPSVAAAEKMLIDDENEDKEYQPIDGKPEYKKPVQQLLFPDEVVDSGCLATLQALSGTGSLQMVGQFLVSMGCKKIYGPDPTWGNHPKIMNRAGLDYGTYPYWHQESRGLNFDGMIEAMKKMNEGEAILLHAVAHNPTGVDPTKEQWDKIVQTVKEQKLIPLLDNAYQGYASGNLAEDNYATKVFTDQGLEFFLCQSFAKNFGLYGERIGYIHVKCASKDAADRVLSQLKIVIRQAYSSPPRHGAYIVNKVLSTPALKEQWLGELKLMSDRIVSMRGELRKAVESKGTPGTWKHITDQIGMFTFTGLSKDQVTRMVDEFHIYMTADGRISMAGLNAGNVDYVAECIDKVVRG